MWERNIVTTLFKSFLLHNHWVTADYLRRVHYCTSDVRLLQGDTELGISKWILKDPIGWVSKIILRNVLTFKIPTFSFVVLSNVKINFYFDWMISYSFSDKKNTVKYNLILLFCFYLTYFHRYKFSKRKWVLF